MRKDIAFFSKELEKTKELEESRVALMNILEDVEEARKKAEEEKNKTLTIINNFTDGLLVFDEENRISLINPRAEKFLNIEGKNIIGSSVSDLVTFPIIEQIITLITKEPKEIFRKEVQIKKNLILEISIVPITNEENDLETLVILHDITREKLIEKMKTEFVSLSAHQLRTPLSAIKWTLKIFLEGDLGEITSEQRNFLEKIYKSNERMISLINDLLDITRIEEGKYLFNPIWSDIERIIQFVINSYKEEIEKKNLILEFQKSEKKMPQIKIDVEKITMAIQNILDNAIKYSPVGSQIIIFLTRDEKEIIFSIKDNGPGIPEEQKEMVFTKFFRGSNILKIETEGSGLGLFIAKNIIEAHRGKIWFESGENKGSTFYFTLPIKEREKI